MAGQKKKILSVFGLLSSEKFHQVKCCAEDLFKQEPDSFCRPNITGFLEFEWDLFVEAKKKDLRGDAWVFKDDAITFVNEQFLGNSADFLAWAQEVCQFDDFRSADLYKTLAEQAYKNHINANKHKYVHMDVTIGDEAAGRLVIEMFDDVTPKTCENFRCLCTGEKGNSERTDYTLHYKGSQFHRIVPNGWIQGGDIWHGRGDGGEAVHGPSFDDENFGVKHTRRGMVGMANKGRHTNQSQFYITLAATPWMDTKYVAFGQVIEGTETLKKMEMQDCINERPNKDVRVADCGVCTYPF